MSPWKVILATLVIFTSGLITGGVAVKYLSQPPEMRVHRPPEELLLRPQMLREEFVRQMQKNLTLSPQQDEKILRAVHDSQERIRIYYDLIGPDIREELRQTREAIQAELSPEQVRQFEELVRRRRPKAAEMTLDKRRSSLPAAFGLRSDSSSNDHSNPTPGGQPLPPPPAP